MQLELETRVDGHLALVGVRGEIDNFSAPQLRDALTAAFADGVRTVIVDLTRTDFLDSSALGALVGVHLEHRESGGELRVACPKPQLRKLFRISHLDEVLDVRDTVAEATHG